MNRMASLNEDVGLVEFARAMIHVKKLPKSL